MNKPPFDPTQPFEPVYDQKPEFDPTQPFEPVHTDVSQTESGLRGLAQGASLGLVDEATGAGEALTKAVAGPDQLADLIENYKKYRDQSRQNYQLAEAANPMTYGAGELGGAVAASLIPGLNIGKGAQLAEFAAKGALQGGLTGLGRSEAETPEDIALDTAKGAGIGLAAGGAGGLAVKGVEKSLPAIQKGLNKISDKLDQIAETHSAKTLGATYQTFKDMMRARDLGRKALDEGIVTPLAGTEKMLGRAEALKEAGGQKMGEVYNTIDEARASTFNPLDVAVRAENELDPIYRTPINKSEWGQLDNTIDSILARARGTDRNITLKEAQALKEEIKAVAYPKGKRILEPTPKQQMAMDAYDIVNKEIDDAAQIGADVLNISDLKDTLKQGKELYGVGRESEKLLTNKLAKETIGSKGLGATDMVTNYIANKTNPLIATGSNALSGIVKSAPEVVNKGSIYAAKTLQPEIVKAGSDKVLTNTSQKLYTAPDQELLQLSQQLSNTPGQQHLAKSLQTAIAKNDRVSKNAVLFTIMQTPTLRKMIETDNLTEK